MNKEQLIELLNDLVGQFKILNFEEGLPILFLFDEDHDNVNGCIEYNIRNAKILIEKANVQIVGVESLAGGKEWDRDTYTYVQDDFNEKWYQKQVQDYFSKCRIFVDGLKAEYSHLIQGVESIGMHDRIFEVHDYEGQRHPLHITRSNHFISTLFENYSLAGIDCNLILNCGSDHNSDFENWILNKSMDKIAGIAASYVRINTFNI